MKDWITDYGHMKDKSQIIQILFPSKYLGCGYKGLVFCRNNGWFMSNMDKGSQYQNELDTWAERQLFSQKLNHWL